MRKVHNRLRKNWRILRELVQNRIEKCSLEDLREKGFHSKYCTAHKMCTDFELIFQCYDIEYVIYENQQLKILSSYSSRLQKSEAKRPEQILFAST
jgi:hypothetical protein